MLRVTTIVNEIFPADLAIWKMNLIRDGLLPKTITEHDALLGTLGHECVEKMKLTKSGAKQENIIRMYQHLKNFLKEYNPTYLATEKEIIYTSDEGNYIGHVDILAKINNENWLIDTKTHGLYKKYDETEEFKPMLSIQKTKTNLQTWLYSLTNNGAYKDYRRGILHINQYGYKLVELKRKPQKHIQHAAFSIISQYNKTHIF